MEYSNMKALLQEIAIQSKPEVLLEWLADYAFTY